MQKSRARVIHFHHFHFCTMHSPGNTLYHYFAQIKQLSRKCYYNITIICGISIFFTFPMMENINYKVIISFQNNSLEEQVHVILVSVWSSFQSAQAGCIFKDSAISCLICYNHSLQFSHLSKSIQIAPQRKQMLQSYNLDVCFDFQTKSGQQTSCSVKQHCQMQMDDEFLLLVCYCF